MTRQDYQCPTCQKIEEVVRSICDEKPVMCPSCHVPMFAYFGRMNAEAMVVNYGFRPHRYNNEVDRNIAKFQFKNL